ncbi:hypothetical protein BVRB_9g213610 [Beta vulgaris subsp. vulgaris]|nr:hypothetical protein BVRB_9g213610 [Beta vulgaris subsp. vulgaris]
MDEKEKIQAKLIKRGLSKDLYICNVLIAMQFKLGFVENGESLFKDMMVKDLVSWNSMISGYVSIGDGCNALVYFRSMQAFRLVPDRFIIISALGACSIECFLKKGKRFNVRLLWLLALIWMQWFRLQMALLDMYNKCSDLEYSERYFSGIFLRSIGAYNAMIAHVQNASYSEGLKLFKSFLKAILQPEAVINLIIASISPAYAELSSLREGEQIHGYVIKSGLTFNAHTSNAIAYMNAKCGDLIRARKLLDIIFLKDVVSWNTIILVYGLHSFGNVVIELFNGMLAEGIQPNESTFVSLLSSCSTSGMFEEGWKYFNITNLEYGIDPVIEHYGCMVDLSGRKGCLNSALSFIEHTPLIPTFRIWGSLLAASRNSKDEVTTELAAQHILSLDHDIIGCYLLLSNLYAELGRWEDDERIIEIMQKNELERTLGCTMVEVNGKTNRFMNDESRSIS